MPVLSRIETRPHDHSGDQSETAFVREETGRKAALAALSESAILAEEQLNQGEQASEEGDPSLAVEALCAAYLAEVD